jgi:hypothetical protein
LSTGTTWSALSADIGSRASGVQQSSGSDIDMHQY